MDRMVGPMMQACLLHVSASSYDVLRTHRNTDPCLFISSIAALGLRLILSITALVLMKRTNGGVLAAGR